MFSEKKVFFVKYLHLSKNPTDRDADLKLRNSDCKFDHSVYFSLPVCFDLCPCHHGTPTVHVRSRSHLGRFAKYVFLVSSPLDVPLIASPLDAVVDYHHLIFLAEHVSRILVLLDRRSNLFIHLFGILPKMLYRFDAIFLNGFSCHSNQLT